MTVTVKKQLTINAQQRWWRCYRPTWPDLEGPSQLQST